MENMEDIEKALNQAMDPATSAVRLAELAYHKERDVRLEVAKHKDTPSGVRLMLAEDPDWRVRRAVAESLFSPARVLSKSARDEDPDIRLAAAENPNTAEEDMINLMQDEYIMVRRALAEKRIMKKLIAAEGSE